MKRVAYGKIGRVIELDPKKWGESGGDNEAPVLLMSLAERHPDIEWVVVGKNSGWTPPLPNITNMWQSWKSELKMPASTHVFDRIRRYDEVTMPTFRDLDGVVMWVGQHGSSNYPIPKIEDRSVLTSPQSSFVAYSSFILRGINAWRSEDPLNREETWLLADVRNYLKARDLKNPRRHPILTQFDFARREKLERYGADSPEWLAYEQTRFPEQDLKREEDGVWSSLDTYRYSGLELVGIQDPNLDEWRDWSERKRFGILINEARAYGMKPEMSRIHAMHHYVKPLDPDWVRGTWPQTKQQELGLMIEPLPYREITNFFHWTKSTFTTPSSGSEWATAKPWEAFATGTICFMHPGYDTQGHIVPTLDQLAADGGMIDDDLASLVRWLRVDNPDDLASRVAAVESSRETYEWLAAQQLRVLTQAREFRMTERLIGARLGEITP